MRLSPFVFLQEEAKHSEDVSMRKLKNYKEQNKCYFIEIKMILGIPVLVLFMN